MVAGSAAIAGESLQTLLLRRILGASPLSTYSILAATLGGLGIGAWYAGDRRIAKHLTVTRALIALSVATATAPSLTTLLEHSISSTLASTHAFVRALLGAAMVAPLAFLQGFILTQLSSVIGTNAPQQVGYAGAASSLGSAIGSLLMLTLVAPELGLRYTLYVAALLFAASAWLCRAESTQAQRLALYLREAQTMDAKLNRSVISGLVCIGFASTTLQIAALKMLTLSVGPTALTFATVLAAHTLSLSVGEFFIAHRLSRRANSTVSLTHLLALSMVMTTVSTFSAERLAQWAQQFFSHTTPTVWTLTVRSTAWALGVLAPTIVVVGALIALSAETVSAHNNTGNLQTDRAPASPVFAATAVGNVLAIMMASLSVVASRGPMSGFALAALALVVALILRVRATRGDRLGVAAPPLPLWSIAVTLCSLAMVLHRVYHVDYEQHTRAPYLYARSQVLGQLVSVTHSAQATVSVRTDDTAEFALQIDGKIDATARSDDDTQTLLALIPAAVCLHPERALVIGLGSGRTVDALRSVESVRSIVVAERLASVVAAASGPFSPSNHNVLSSSKVRLVLDDASSVLRASGEDWDVIVSEPSNPWVSGMSELFTVDFFALTHRKLRHNGVFAAWFHSENPTLFAQLIATFRAVYPRSALVELNPRGDWLLLGLKDRASVNVDQLDATLSSAAVRVQLTRIGIDSTAEVLARFVAGPDGMTTMTAGVQPLYASELFLEFAAPTMLYAPSARPALQAMLALAQDLPLAGLSPVGTRYQSLIDDANTLREAALHARQREWFAQLAQLDESIREGELAVAAAPRAREHRVALARVYVRRASRRYRTGDRGGTEADFRSALEVGADAADSFRASTILGDFALNRRDNVAAIRWYRRALSAAEQAGASTPELHVRLAQLLVASGDAAGARAELLIARETCRTDERCAQIAAALRQLSASVPQ